MFDPTFVKMLQDYNYLRLYMINCKANYHQLEADLSSVYRRIKTHEYPLIEIADKMTLFNTEHRPFFDYYDNWWFDYYKK